MNRPLVPEQEHNRRQRQYFETTGQRTLKVADSPYLRRHVDELMEAAGISPGDRVLEVGCGMGRYTAILASRGVRVEGLDLSADLLEELRSRHPAASDIPLHCGDIVDVPEEMWGTFDSVIGFFVVHHVHDVQACLQAAARLVKVGGRVTFLEPNPLSPLYYIQIALTPGMAWRAEKGLLRMRPRILTAAMQQAGLDGIIFRRFGFFPPFLANRRWGPAVESALERVLLWRPMLPFLVFTGERNGV